MEQKRELGLKSAIFIVIASMIGPGVFITTGTLLELTGYPLLILGLWAAGGIIAVTGSLCYAELCAIWPHAGGEYIYLRNIFGMMFSFLTGWVSLIVGFSASIAISAISLIEYINQILKNVMPLNSPLAEMLDSPFEQKATAAIVILLFSLIHMLGAKFGSRVQNILTGIKLFIVMTLIGFGLWMVDWNLADRLVQPISSAQSLPGVPVIGLALLIVMYSYSGWNGATYIAGEIRDPEKNLPKALLIGTILTTIIYLLLNAIFLISSPPEQIIGQESIGVISARNLFGIRLSSLFSLGIVFILFSSISVQTMIGPRVYYAMAKDGMLFRGLAKLNPRFHTPLVSIAIQMLLSIIYVLIGNPRMLMEYMGFALGVFPVLTVAGLIYMRVNHPSITRPYRVPMFPIVPLVFIASSVIMLAAGFAADTHSSWIAVAVLAAGIPVYLVWHLFIYKRRAKGDALPAIKNIPSTKSGSVDEIF